MNSLEGCTKRSERNPGQSPGTYIAKQLSGRQYLAYGKLRCGTAQIARYCLPGSRIGIDIPRTLSSVTTALPPFGQWVQGQISLSTAFQAGRDIFFIISTN